MREDFEKYPSVELDNEEYLMVPMKMNLDSSMQRDENFYRDNTQTYIEDEDFIENSFAPIEDLYGLNIEEDSNEEFQEDLFRTEEIMPKFGVPLFIEERYIDDESFEGGFRGSDVNLEQEEIDEKLSKVEKYDPNIFAKLESYGISYIEAKNIIRRVLRTI